MGTDGQTWPQALRAVRDTRVQLLLVTWSLFSGLWRAASLATGLALFFEGPGFFRPARSRRGHSFEAEP
jgi:hypothetical protein